MVDSSIINLKLIVLGDATVGKSSLINRMALNTFEGYTASTAMGYYSKNIKVREQQYSVTFYDTYGKERKTYWNEDLVTKITKIEDAAICIIGNKTDLNGKKEVCDDEVRDFANKKNYLYKFVSAKTGEGVNEMLGMIMSFYAKEFNNVVSIVYKNKNKKINETCV